MASADITLWTAVLTALCCAIMTALYVAAQMEPIGIVLLLPRIAVFVWLEKDARRTGVGAVQDWGFFLFLAFPVLIPWYALKTRGRAGWALLVALFGLIYSPDLTGHTIAWLLNAGP
jgi:hypothetical protein